MTSKTIQYTIVAAALVLLSGCASMREALVTKVEIPIPVPCNIIAPKKPVMPFTDNPLIEDQNGVVDLFKNGQSLLAEIEVRKGYETELEAAVQACNSRTINK